MGKSAVDRLRSSSHYREILGVDYTLSDNIMQQITDFDNCIGMTSDRRRVLCVWILYGLDNWVERWQKIKALGNNATLDYFTLYYGEKEGQVRYKSSVAKKSVPLNKNKTRQSQQEKLKHARDVRKERGDCHPKQPTYWIKNFNMTHEEAIQHIKDSQPKNTLEWYITRYGENEGTRLFEERRNKWVNTMQSLNIGPKRSLGLPRYIERYGEKLGRERYVEMRLKRNIQSPGTASKESLKVFKKTIDVLDSLGIFYFLGVEGNKEFFIYDRENTKCYLYDLTIPSLDIIIEYHGEAFHPNPNWCEEKWNAWAQAYTNASADLQFQHDTRKKVIAESKGWEVITIYSSDIEKRDNLHNFIADRIALQSQQALSP